jgi:osmotically inducible protein OsmC
MPIRKARAVWEGNLKEGKGTMSLDSGVFNGTYSFSTRFEGSPGTNPEELIAAAHAGCFSMALANGLSQAGHKPKKVSTQAKVHLDKEPDGFTITLIELITEVEVEGISESAFQNIAAKTKEGCPVSRALAAVDITLTATLKK